jgi:hypothetical protein
MSIATKNGSHTAAGKGDQYSPLKIIGLWAATALPLAFMGWVVFPAIAPDWGVDSMGVGSARMATISVALPAKYFRSTWVSVTIHGSINVMWSVMILALILS